MQKLAKVLLVDDDSTTNFLNTRLLTRLEVAEELLVARNGVEALRMLEQTCSKLPESAGPILVLLDVNMPVMDGLEFLETYKQHPLAQKGQVVVVMLTTSEHAYDLERIKAVSLAADILAKPLTQEKVETILHRCFH